MDGTALQRGVTVQAERGSECVCVHAPEHGGPTHCCRLNVAYAKKTDGEIQPPLWGAKRAGPGVLRVDPVTESWCLRRGADAQAHTNTLAVCDAAHGLQLCPHRAGGRKGTGG